jgi:outer membrane protein assembly complex protein YaeT
MLKRTAVCCALLAWGTPCQAADGAPPAELRVSSVSFGGNAAFSDRELLGAVELRPGAVWTGGKAAFDGELLTSFYHNRGYSDARINVSSLPDGTSVHVRLEIAEGPVYSFGRTTVTGLRALTERVVKKELDYREGDPYSYERLIRSQSRLYAANWFEQLRTSVSSSSASRQIDVKMSAREKPMLWVKTGAGYGSEEKERLSLGLTHNNFLGRGYQAQVTGTLSRIWLEYHGELLNRHFLFSRTELRDGLTWRRERREGYDLESVKNLLSLGRQVHRHVSVSVQYRLQRTLVFNVDPQLTTEAPSLSQTRSVSVAVNRDTTDDFFYPGGGSRSEAALERSGGLWGGDIDFYKGTLRHTLYHRLFWKVTGMLSAAGGFIQETGRTLDVPIFERFFLGGGNSVRGYGERDVGPEDANGNPLGGKTSLEGHAELRFPIYKAFKGALFLDGGQVADSLSGSAPANWKYGAGGGLRYLTPVGPIRLDFGYKLNPEKPTALAKADTWRIHFTIGEAF